MNVWLLVLWISLDGQIPVIAAKTVVESQELCHAKGQYILDVMHGKVNGSLTASCIPYISY